MKLPALNRLTHSLNARRIGGTTVSDSMAFLDRHQADLLAYRSIEDLAVAAYGDVPEANARALAHHLQCVRDALAEELWSRQIFVGASLLDDLLFFSIAAGGRDPLLRALEYLRDRRVTRAGMAVFALHSFGVIGAGGPPTWTNSGPTFTNGGWGLAITPQTNVLDRTIDFLETARTTLGIAQQIPREMVRSWHRSRAPWLESNPLLAVRLIGVPGSYYDNQRFVVDRVAAATGLLAMLAALHPVARAPAGGFSTSIMNNRETLDIHHYGFLHAAGSGRELDGMCVPIHAGGVEVTELSALPVQFDPRQARNRTAALIETAVSTVYDGHLASMVRRARRNARDRTYERLFRSMAYFRRSFQSSQAEWTAIVSLATAFEMALTDNYSRGIEERLRRRVALLLRGVAGTRSYQQAVVDLYSARSEIVHSGSAQVAVDMEKARAAYVLCFAELGPRVQRLSPTSATPILDLTGDARDGST